MLARHAGSEPRAGWPLPIARRHRRHVPHRDRTARAGAGRRENASRRAQRACRLSCNRSDCPWPGGFARRRRRHGKWSPGTPPVRPASCHRAGSLAAWQGTQRQLKRNRKGTRCAFGSHGGNCKGTLQELFENKVSVSCGVLQPSRRANTMKGGRNTPLGSPDRSIKALVLAAICGGPTVLESLHTIRTSFEAL